MDLVQLQQQATEIFKQVLPFVTVIGALVVGMLLVKVLWKILSFGISIAVFVAVGFLVFSFF